jgi:tetratricopeptide (TPR) repeat protein
METAVAEKIRGAHARIVADRGAGANWAFYARTLHAHGLTREAIDPYVVAASRSEMPEKFKVTYLAGHCASKVDPERAVTLLREAAALRDDYLPLHLRLGSVYESLGRWEDAGASYERAESLNSGEKRKLSHPLGGLGRVRLAQGRVAEAIAALERARNLDPENADVHAGLAAAYGRSGRTGDALRETALAGDLQDSYGFPDPIASEMRVEGVSYKALELLGSAALLGGSHDRALGAFERALAMRPNDPDAMLNKAQALCAVGRLTDAESIVDRALALRADSAVALGLKGACALGRGDHRGAVAYLARTLELDPRNPTNRWNYARALRAVGNAAEAKKQFRILLEKKPHRSDVRLDFARALEQDGNVAEALSEVDLVLAREPENRDAKALRDRLSR